MSPTLMRAPGRISVNLNTSDLKDREDVLHLASSAMAFAYSLAWASVWIHAVSISLFSPSTSAFTTMELSLKKARVALIHSWLR